MFKGKRAAQPWCGLLFFGIVSVSAQASAAEPSSSMPGMSTLKVALSGEISARCEISGGGVVDFGELAGGKQSIAPLALDCNVPFQIGFESAHGGLVHQERPSGQGPYAGILGYTVAVAVPTRRPAESMLRAEFDSRDLKSERSINSGAGIAVGVGFIKLTTARPEGAGLLAGQYAETLRVTIQPSV
jgi:hypothetical protein